MPRGSSSKASKSPKSSKSKSREEIVVVQSPAEFFAEHQNIAGFDNPGKSLYTTIRELVENSLDAAEAIEKLPKVDVLVEELDADAFASLRGLPATSPVSEKEGGDVEESSSKGKKGQSYFRVTVEDNGAGMRHEAVPEMLGRVLSGSKHGVRQTRGKFGLGAKMALIWAKKSTGLPIEVTTAHTVSAEAALRGPPSRVTYCKLDIDVTRNEPNVLEFRDEENTEGFVGTKMSLVVGGQWGVYRARLLQYMQQLAVITPYAALSLEYRCRASPSREFAFQWRRRSTRAPPVAPEVKHHPASVNNLLVRQLADRHVMLHPESSVVHFLRSSFSRISSGTASDIVASLAEAGIHESTKVNDLDARQIHVLTQTLREREFEPPDGSCLSPAGEYNLRLGIMKELGPKLVATHTAPVGVYEGHPFLVEAGVAIGGDAAEGVTVHRFANRIPLLFEGGGDVVTRTAAQRIKWASYKIDHRRDKVGVFVSVVSTKIPFKGTGKEYIGDDIVEIQNAVKTAIQACCAQLRVKLVHRQQTKDKAARRKNLTRYIPDISNSLLRVLHAASDRAKARADSDPMPKRRRVLDQLDAGTISKEIVDARLRDAVAASDDTAALDSALRHATMAPNHYYIRPLRAHDTKAMPTFSHPKGGLAIRFLPNILEKPYE